MPVFRLRDRLKFRLERWMQRGAGAQLLFMAGVIISVAVLGGVIAWLFSGAFDHAGDAIWWAFLRLTDPGYLGDDEGALLRTVSTVITILGYVLFLGSLIAILTQWLNRTMRRLESGLTPIFIRNHILVLGWTNRTPTIIRELLLSEGRVRRFLNRRGVRKLRIVILAEEVSSELMIELREALGSQWSEGRIILRSGTSLRVEHLRRVAYRDAAVIIIPGADFLLGGAEATDSRVIKTLISLAPVTTQDRGRAPAVVAEVFDTQKVPVAENAYAGGEVNVIASDSLVSRLIAQNVRHRGLSFVYSELPSHGHGNEVYVRRFPEFGGMLVTDVAGAFRNAILLGAVRPVDGRFEPHLAPPPQFQVQENDRLVFIARSYEDCTADEAPSRANAIPVGSAMPGPTASTRRILILGWSHKVPALISEFASYADESFQIDLLSRTPIAEREAALAPFLAGTSRVTASHFSGDYALRWKLAGFELDAYDNIVFLGSDRMESGEESDARTILGYVLMRSMLDSLPRSPEVLIELLDAENARLFRRRRGEVIISPQILSHMLAHVALRQELSSVFGELFGPGGAEFFFRRAADYDLAGERIGMQELALRTLAHGEIALGVRLRSEFERPGGGVRLNPPPEERWILQPDDEIIVLAMTRRRS